MYTHHYTVILCRYRTIIIAECQSVRISYNKYILYLLITQLSASVRKNSKNNQHNLLQKENHKRMYYFLTEQNGFVDLPKIFK